MRSFTINGILWHIVYVNPNSKLLIDRTNKRTVATTDPISRCVYMSKEVGGAFFCKVLIHELGHCIIISYNLFDDIHRMVREDYWIEAEEWVCNFMANYGFEVFKILRSLYGNDVLKYIPREMELSFIA